MTHTPGPWRNGIETEKRKKTFYVEHVKIGKTICYMSSGVGMTDCEMRANTNLIAAAPDLLEALKDLVEWLRLTGDDGSVHGKTYDYVSNARAAINKAEKGAL